MDLSEIKNYEREDWGTDVKQLRTINEREREIFTTNQ